MTSERINGQAWKMMLLGLGEACILPDVYATQP